MAMRRGGMRDDSRRRIDSYDEDGLSGCPKAVPEAARPILVRARGPHVPLRLWRGRKRAPDNGETSTMNVYYNMNGDGKGLGRASNMEDGEISVEREILASFGEEKEKQDGQKDTGVKRV